MLVEGLEVDTVATVSPHFDDVIPFQHIMQQYRKLAGGPWTDSAEEKKFAFSRIMMGDTWREDLPSNWPSVSDVEPRTPLSDADKQNVQMWQLVALCCARRHFFITKQGRFGLGPSEMKSGELVCVLLGSDIPLLLLRTELRGQ